MARRPLLPDTALAPAALSLALFLAATPGVCHAQTNQLRGLPQSGNSLLPSAQQQLNQNLNRQRNSFSTRQQIEGARNLDRTNQINRLNTLPDRSVTPCPGTSPACNQAQ